MILNDPDSIKYFKLLDNKFFKKLLENISSFDSDERIIIKLILHKLYGSSYQFRNLIIKHIERKLIDFIYSTNKLTDISGINDLLDLLKVKFYLSRVYIRGFSKTGEEKLC
jgi:hypothetical protein